MQPCSSHALPRRLERHGRQAERRAEERGEGAAERVADSPDRRVGVEGGEVCVEVLRWWSVIE